ncbi:bifunctional protein-serine/threonine kinase/phosphatase [Teredinibacter franksiae]|uniref:bifunctional protein-serine/threonine kinase/phosphatase n=1 Tax=Teredinibacter franksiae TaxID=2761453 RepID=UPI00162359D2|nr:bifunctional protein-serine/threonine kinase/phosphatase [Teredinibacter franksiae]
MSATLKIETAYQCVAGRKSLNEDSAGALHPAEDFLLQNKGVALVVADGVSSAEAGQEASRTAVARFIEDYYKTPETWSVGHAGEKILTTLNLHLYRKSHEFVTEGKGYLCTFSAAIIKSRTAHFFHVGDSRIYHLQKTESGEWQINQLTQDHTAFIERNHAILARAVGMDSRLNIDYGRQPVAEGDRLLLTSDGVHDFLTMEDLRVLLAGEGSAEAIAEKIKDSAYEKGSDDNISALVAKIETLPEESLDDYSIKLTRLPFPPEMSVGMKIDGFEVKEILFASARSQLYLVEDKETGATYAMKTPSRNYEDDISYIDRFIQEEWIGSRIDNDYVVKVIKTKRKKSCLYYLMEYVDGRGLDTWIEENQPPSPKRAIAIVKQIALGLQAFHQNEAIHQDLRPANVLITKDEKAVIVDFGSVYVAGLAELQRPLEHLGALGTASYSDPLYLMGRNPGIKGDVYALATITYEIFTGNLPYGSEVEECRTAFDYDRLRYREASRFNPVIPLWFDGAMKKGVAFDLEERYGSIASLIKDLSQPNPGFLKIDPVEEKQASSLMFWKLLSGFWFFTFFLLMYLFSQAK